MFTLTSLQIYPNCKYIKNLACGVYKFGKYQIPDFYGENVSLHVIVGKNGSGKSSLIDIALRMVNNLGAIICKDELRAESAKVRYIRHLYADLEYEFSDTSMTKHKCKLCIRDKALWLIYDDFVYWLSDRLLVIDLNSCAEYNNIKENYNDGHFHDYRDLTQEKKVEIAKLFFYTIATNYSMLGFQSSDYEEEESLEFDDSIELTDEDGNIFTDENGNQWVTADWVESRNWLDGIFHKNDGYMCPIVLNPFRDDGHINMKNEYSLTTDRLSALLIYEFKDKTPIIDDYYLDKVKYNLKTDFYQRFTPIFSPDDKNNRKRKNILSDGGDLILFKKAALSKGSWSWVILNTLDSTVEEDMSDVEIFVRLYIVYKILNIAATYPVYSQFRNQGKIDKVFSDHLGTPVGKLKALTKMVMSRFTHVEQKFHQAYHFVCLLKDARSTDPNFDTKWCETAFSYETYYDKLKINKKHDSVEQCMRFLPPGIFKKTILLKRKGENGTDWDEIPLYRMSSGQRQMLYQMTTIVYHLLNLKSVLPTDIRYSNVNIVLDEIEVCFHPEYQRNFISQVLDLLVDRLHINKYLNIHFWITTHSPFILSDVPEELVTYMEDGHQLSEDDKTKQRIRTPMAGNIGELLHQSFFLHNGFVGEFARKRVLDLLKFLTTGEDNNYKWDIEKAKNFIDGIGDPYIKKQLHILLSKK